jgi:gluconate 2-dehydrogenase gamma chain
MANQSPDRREVVAMLTKVAGLSQFSGFSKWVFAAGRDRAQATVYRPQYFTAAEYATLDFLCELIIPADETPGARQAGVSEFIDFMVSQDGDLQYPFRTGLAWLDAFSTEKFGGRFVDLASTQQELLLTKLSDPNERPGYEFFSLARKYTVIGYYTSRIGLEELDYPGLRLYSASPECPHKSDPEHKHLPAAR